MLEGWPGEELLKKLWETLDKGLCGALRPWQIRREGRANAEARRHELLLLAQAEVEAERIRNGDLTYDLDGALLPAPKPNIQRLEPPPEALEYKGNAGLLLEIGSHQFRLSRYNEIKRGLNLRKIAIFAEEAAEELAKEDPTTSERPVDPDWFSKWRGNAEDISDEQMQRLWAKVLAGEVSQPESFSLRALNLLSFMSKRDAELISKLADLNIGTAIVNVNQKYYDGIGLPLHELIYLSDIGVLNAVSTSMGISQTLNFNELAMPTGKKSAVLIKVGGFGLLAIRREGQTQASIELPIYTISQPALELLKLVKPQLNIDYLRQIAKTLSSTGLTEEFLYGPIETLPNGRVEFANTIGLAIGD